MNFPVKFPISGEFDWRRRDQHCVASHALPLSTRLSKRRRNGPEIRTFRAIDSVSGPVVRISGGRNRQKSPAKPANIPVLQPETGSITPLPPEDGSPRCVPFATLTRELIKFSQKAYRLKRSISSRPAATGRVGRLHTVRCRTSSNWYQLDWSLSGFSSQHRPLAN
jgi:hypothetical protein